MENKFVLPGHQPATCPCVACRIYRKEKPNPTTKTKTSKKRNYLWISDGLDHEVTTLAIELNCSKAKVVRDAIIKYINERK
jgi:hypothetical protein